MNPQETEVFVTSQVQLAFEACFTDVRVFSSIVIPLPHAEHATTAEIDCLIVCNAGVYMFEIKNWRNTLVTREQTIGNDRKQWFLNNYPTRRVPVADPISQGFEKYLELRRHLDERIHLRSYALICGENLQIAADMPACVLVLDDLPYLTRVLRSEVKRHNRCEFLDAECVALVAGLVEKLSHGMSHEEHVRTVMASKAAAAALAAL